MIATEDEAKTKTCAVKDGCPKCEGTACMGWQWLGWRDRRDGDIFTGTRRRHGDDEKVGTCGYKTPQGGMLQ